MQQALSWRLRSNVVAPIDALLYGANPTLRDTKAPSGGALYGRVGHAAALLGIYVLHVACVAYFIAAGCVYRALPSTQLAIMLDYNSLTLETRHFREIGSVHLLFASIHAYVLAVDLVLMTKRGATLVPSFRQSAGRLLSSPTITRAVSKMHVLQSRVLDTRLVHVKKIMRVACAVLMTPHVFFDVETKHFDVAFLAREVVEVFFQAYQAYKMSRLLPRPLLNRCYVAILVLNCWSTPFLQHLSGRKETLARLLCLQFDVLLNAVSLIGVPLLLMLDYTGSYDGSITNFPDFLWYNDAWLVRYMHDAPLILLGSWIEGAGRLAFSLSMLLTIHDIKKLINRKAGTNGISVVAQTETVSVRRVGIVRWTHRGMLLFGLAILGFQIYAEGMPTVRMCAVQVHPWFTSQSTCALIEIDCSIGKQRSGDRTDFESIFAQLEPTALKHIVIRHCPHVELTSRFLTFRNLIGFKTYNTTLVTWGSEARVSQAHHPHLHFIYFVRTEFANAALPEGILPIEVPELLGDIEICVSNLHALPDNLHEYWPQPLVFLVEFAQLTEFPMVLTKMHPFILSLANNHITSLPHDALLLSDPFLVAFTGNPITTIPDLGNESAAVTTMQLFFDATLVAGPLPEWIDDAFVQHTTLYVGGSPFCEQVVLNTSSPDRPGLLASRPWLLDGRVDCTVFADPSFYPLRVDDHPDNPDTTRVKRPV